MKESVEKFEGSANKLFHEWFELGLLLHNALFERDQHLTANGQRRAPFKNVPLQCIILFSNVTNL